MRSQYGFAVMLISLLCVAPGSAQEKGIPGDRVFLNADMTEGDSPLVPFFTWSGNGAVVFATDVFAGISNPAGSLVLAGVPATATIVSAYLNATAWLSVPGNASAEFNGVQLGTVAAKVEDPDGTFYCSLWQWDVTELVTGNGSYTYSTSGLSNAYLAYLVVVYEDAGSPELTALVNDGAESLQNAFSVTTFNSAASSVDGNLLILVEAADLSGTPMEYVMFNGDTLAGPGEVFSSNLGNYGDMLIFHDLEVLLGDNTLEIGTGSDWFGIHLAILSTAGISTDIGLDESGQPSSYGLFQNYPNPFNPSTNVEFGMRHSEWVKLEVFDIAGRHVRTLVDGQLSAGNHTVQWDGTNAAGEQVVSGIYLYRLTAGEFTETRKMLLAK